MSLAGERVPPGGLIPRKPWPWDLGGTTGESAHLQSILVWSSQLSLEGGYGDGIDGSKPKIGVGERRRKALLKSMQPGLSSLGKEV